MIQNQITQLRTLLALIGSKTPTPAGDESSFLVAFDATTPMPMVLGVIAAGQAVTSVVLIVEIPFNAGAAITFGTSLDPSAYLAAGDSTPAKANQYASFCILPNASNDLLLLTLTGATVGAGVLYYRIYAP
jgi:hypothetical protein